MRRTKLGKRCESILIYILMSKRTFVAKSCVGGERLVAYVVVCVAINPTTIVVYLVKGQFESFLCSHVLCLGGG